MPENWPGSEASIYSNIGLKNSRYRPEIDGLRAFAVVAVIINHFNKDILPGGYLGVDIFFVISGYVITSSLTGRPSKEFKDFISGFYERRIKRLVPALSVFILTTSIAICLFNPEPDIQLGIGMRALFGFSNIALYSQSTDYFAQSTELNVFTHTWSLGVEEQFYILFPFLIWFSGFGRQTKNGARNLFLIVGALTIASLISFLYLYPTNQPAAYFLMPSRFWEMAAGCLIFIGFQKRVSIEEFLARVPPLLVLALIIGVMYLPISFAAASTIAVVTLSSILIASLKKQTAAFNIFTHPKVVYIGLISYSLYLWHWGVLSISHWTIGIHWWSVPCQIALMLGLAVASYRWVETPLRKGNWFRSRWKTLMVGGGVLVMVSGGLVALGNPLKGKFFTGNYNFEELITRSRNYTKRDGGYNGINCHLTDKKFTGDLPLNQCMLKGSPGKRTIVFAGNSHTDHYRETHHRIHEKLGLSVFSISVSSCLFPPQKQEKCTNNTQGLIEKEILNILQPGDIVVIANRYISGEHKDATVGYDWMLDKQSVERVNRFNKRVASKKARTILFLPTPEYGISVEECKPIWFKPIVSSRCSQSTEGLRSQLDPFYSVIGKYLDHGIVTYDPLPAMCRSGRCSMFDNDAKPLYVDEDHITDYANFKYVYPDFVDFLSKYN